VEQLLGLVLNTFCAVDNHDSTVGSHESTVGIFTEILVTWGI